MTRTRHRVWHDGTVPAASPTNDSTQLTPKRPTPPTSVLRRRRVGAVATLTVALLATMLLSGCMTRSTTVGDRYSGEIVVATSPDNPHGAPQLDVPQSLSSRISVTQFKQTAREDKTRVVRTGSRAYYSDLTAGQFSQLADIITGAFDNSTMSFELSAKRISGVVQLRGTTDLTSLVPGRDFIELSVSFTGPVIATNGEQTGNQTVSWTLPIGKTSKVNADAEYPDPATAAVSSWAWFIGIVCLIVVGLVALIAYRNRDRSPRPGAPARTASAGAGRK